MTLVQQKTNVHAPRSRTAPKEVRRTQLIEATIECIAERGMSRTTMAEVTRRAGLSVGIVSLHFESKDNLLTSTLVHLSEEVRAAWSDAAEDESLDTANKLQRIALASFDRRVFTQTKIAVWFAFFGEARYRAFYREMVESYDDEREDALYPLCQKLIEDTENDNRDPKSLVDAIESFGDGLWLNAVLYGDYFTPEYCGAHVRAFLATQFPTHFGASFNDASGHCTS